MAMHRWRNYAFRYALEAGDFLFLARTEKSKDMNDISTTTNPVSNNKFPAILPAFRVSQFLHHFGECIHYIGFIHSGG